MATSEDTTSGKFSQAAVVGMLSILLVQGFHTIEHLVQVFQRFVFYQPKGAGLLGSWVDVEPVHLGYNIAFLWLIAITYWEGKFWTLRKSRPVAFWILTFAVVWQTWHFVEHLVKMGQFITSGNNGTPGLLGLDGWIGTNFNVVWLHFTYNAVVYAPFLVAFFMLGFHKDVLQLDVVKKLMSRLGMRGGSAEGQRA
jgi:hypothetical protein